MPKIEVLATIPNASPDAVFADVARFERYPTIAKNVIAVAVTGTGDKLASSWEVTFRKGVLKWVEDDAVDHATRRVAFTQTSGDLALFVGAWQVGAIDAKGAVPIEFVAEFDLGIPSLASMLDPVAARTLSANARELIVAFAAAAGPALATFVGRSEEPSVRR